MPRYKVTVKRSVWTDIEVDAGSGVAAMAQVQKYGCTEAASDYKVIDERTRDSVVAVEKLPR